MKVTMVLRYIALALFLVLGHPTLGQCASPRDELLRLVPDDMTFCIVVQDLRIRAANDKAHSFITRLLQVPFAREKLDSPEIKKVFEMEKKVLKDLELTSTQVRDELLGDAIVFAYRQGPSKTKDNEQGMFLLWARDKMLLEKVVERINALQIKTGELKRIAAHTYKDQVFHERVKSKDNKESNEFYWVHDNYLVFSPRRQLIESVIDRQPEEPPGDKRAPFWFNMMARLNIEKSFVSLLMNPRAFDAELMGHRLTAGNAEKAFLSEFLKYWQAFEGLGIYADVDEDLEVGLAIQVRKDALPTAAQRFFAEYSKPSPLWKVIPDDALFAVATRLDLPLLGDVFAGFLETGMLKEIHRSITDSMQPFLPATGKLDMLAKGLGPYWGMWIYAPSTADRSWIPQGILAVKVRDNADGANAELTVRNAIQFLLTTAQLFGKEKITVETIKDGSTEIRTLNYRGVFPEGFRPAFASKDGHLLFAGSPQSIKRFSAPGVNGAKETDETPLLRMSATGWRHYLANNKKDISIFLASINGVDASTIGGQIDLAIENLKAFDRIELIVRGRPEQGTIAFRLRMAPATPR